MSAETKIHLSSFEMELVTNRDWILTKQEILSKVYFLFGEVHEAYKYISLNEEEIMKEFDVTKNGKISKGENYRGLPYVILDYPASFRKGNIFAIRTMFWWGNFFSITLHISGGSILQNLSLSNLLFHIRDTDFFVCVNENEWEHNFDTENYILVNNLDKKQQEDICSKNFIKISKKIDLQKWHEAYDFLTKTYREITGILRFMKNNNH